MHGYHVNLSEDQCRRVSLSRGKQASGRTSVNVKVTCHEAVVSSTKFRNISELSFRSVEELVQV